MASEASQEREDLSERYFWGVVVRVLWTSLILLLVFGVLAALTALLGWLPYLLLGFVGLLAGIALAVAVLGSARSRELTGLILGAVTLPVLAGYLGRIAVESEAAFGAYSAKLMPFLAHATGAVLGGLWIARVWANRPARPEPAGETPRTGEGAPP